MRIVILLPSLLFRLFLVSTPTPPKLYSHAFPPLLGSTLSANHGHMDRPMFPSRAMKTHAGSTFRSVKDVLDSQFTTTSW